MAVAWGTARRSHICDAVPPSLTAAWFIGLGPVAAIWITALAFGLSHGLLIALPVLTLFGAILAWLRSHTRSLYPPIILHALFNGSALIAAVTVGGGL